MESLQQNGLSAERMGVAIRRKISGGLKAAVRRGVIYRERGLYYADCQNIDDYPRADLLKHLLSAMGGTWWERDEAIVVAARYLGFRRTGKRIKAAFRSAINSGIRRGLIERDGANWIRRT